MDDNTGCTKFKHNSGELWLGDCLELMAEIPSESVDLILCDLPYGTTQNKWDAVIPFDALWDEYRRICKPNAPIVLTSAQPFTSALISSNPKEFRYSLVWDKVGTTGFQNAKNRPLRRHEDICVFSKAKSTYNPIMEVRGKPRKKGGKRDDKGCYNPIAEHETFNNEYYPTSIITISNASKKGIIHPTQKPVALFEYLIRTYSDEGALVLDNCSGSGTTAIACMETNRKWLCIERDEAYFAQSRERIEAFKTDYSDDLPPA